MKLQKDTVKRFLFLFVVGYLIINWSDISWIFNYQEVAGLKDQFLYPYDDKVSIADSLIQVNQSKGATITDHQTAPAIAEDKTTPPPPNNSGVPTDKDMVLEIPAVNLQTSMVFGETTNPNALHKDLDKGVVIYPGSILPGENGQLVILGHSAPPNWPHIKHDWTFTDLEKLKTGDQIFVTINHRQYTYTVLDQSIIQRGQDIGQDALVKNHNILALVSCWPPGKDYQRIVVKAQLQD